MVLMGPSGSGKTTFAQRHFKPTEVVSSDKCRGMVSDDEMKQSATPAALEVLHLIVAKRLAIPLVLVSRLWVSGRAEGPRGPAPTRAQTPL